MDWETAVKEYELSGLSMSAFALQRGLNKGSLSRAVRKYSSGATGLQEKYATGAGIGELERQLGEDQARITSLEGELQKRQSNDSDTSMSFEDSDTAEVENLNVQTEKLTEIVEQEKAVASATAEEVNSLHILVARLQSEMETLKTLAENLTAENRVLASGFERLKAECATGERSTVRTADRLKQLEEQLTHAFQDWSEREKAYNEQFEELKQIAQAALAAFPLSASENRLLIGEGGQHVDVSVSRKAERRDATQVAPCVQMETGKNTLLPRIAGVILIAISLFVGAAAGYGLYKFIH
ncbi:MAG: hypothetical protein ACHQ0Y_08150 [Thermodesulfovibrionales bacterium]